MLCCNVNNGGSLTLYNKQYKTYSITASNYERFYILFY